jgi:hypothetical protein
MGPIRNDEKMTTRATPEVPVRSESVSEPAAGASGGRDGHDEPIDVDERPSAAIEEAGYGYGV